MQLVFRGFMFPTSRNEKWKNRVYPYESFEVPLTPELYSALKIYLDLLVEREKKIAIMWDIHGTRTRLFRTECNGHRIAIMRLKKILRVVTEELDTQGIRAEWDKDLCSKEPDSERKKIATDYLCATLTPVFAPALTSTSTQRRFWAAATLEAYLPGIMGEYRDPGFIEHMHTKIEQARHEDPLGRPMALAMADYALPDCQMPRGIMVLKAIKRAVKTHGYEEELKRRRERHEGAPELKEWAA